MNIKEKIYSLSLLWLIPFILFIIGYSIAHHFFTVKKIAVPHLVGLPIAQGIKKLSDHQLNIRIIAEKEDSDLPAGTIISQKPIANNFVKTQHAIFVAISRKPDAKQMPLFINKKADQVKKELDNLHVVYKIYQLPSRSMPHTILAQSPSFQAALKEPIYVYESTPMQDSYIFPNVKEKSLKNVLSFLEHYNIKPEILYKNHSPKENYQVIEQRPLAGTIISFTNPPNVQLQVQAL